MQDTSLPKDGGYVCVSLRRCPAPFQHRLPAALTYLTVDWLGVNRVLSNVLKHDDYIGFNWCWPDLQPKAMFKGFKSVLLSCEDLAHTGQMIKAELVSMCWLQTYPRKS